MFLNDKELRIHNFEVNKDFGDGEPFFRLITDAGEVQLTKLKFQLDKPLPDTLSCRIKGYNGRIPVLAHNMPLYVSEFYADGFSKGEEFEFKVLSVQDPNKGLYRLSDENGLIFKLREHNTSLVRGQTVKCRFEAISPKYFTIRLSDHDAQFLMHSLSDIARAASVHGLGTQKLEMLLIQIPELEEALEQLNHGRPIWVMTAIRALRPLWMRIFMQAYDSAGADVVLDIIRGFERVLLYLLQGSGFLRNTKGVERQSLQAELTAQLESLDIARRTLRIVANNDQRKFIDGLLDNLKEAGYIYHPIQQFSIMINLFRMSPELVNTSLGNIFDTLMGWDLETWKTEPFRQAFVDQLQIYITDTRQEIDLFLQPETPADNEKIEKVLTAIAIQQSLATDSDSVDIRLNKSLFYRYLSALRTAKADVLLNKSFLALMGVTLPTDFTWSDIKEPTMMMTRAAVDPPASAVLPPNNLYYINNDIEVEVGPEGIAIGKVNSDYNNALPNGMLTWPGVRVNVDRTINRQKLKTMEGHAEFWGQIETDLFVREAESKEQVSVRRMPDIDDTVKIVVDRVIHAANDFNSIEAFDCKIVDDHFIEGRGILPAKNIVNYNLHGVTIGTFRHDNGDQMVFEAQVVDIDDNDQLIFSLADLAHQAIIDMANTGEQCYAVITKDNGRSYSAISEKGFGMYVNKDNDGTPPFRRGNVVRVSITGYSNDAIQSVVEDGPIDSFVFSNARALHNLLSAIAVSSADRVDENMQLEEDETLQSQDLREIIEILRYKAVSCHDNILMAFDYLSFAYILALTIEDEALASAIKAHKQVLLLHQHYAKNKHLYREDVQSVRDMAPNSTLIQRMAKRLDIVASLGHTEDNPLLWSIANDSPQDMERELSQMVLSYNMLYDLNHDCQTAAGIIDKIAQKLNVESEQRSLKYYGSESQYVEFKSSLVYPAAKGKAGISLADPDRQEFEILHIIAGFLNTTGGTLYIGVNDDHYERGLEDDLSFYRLDTSERNNKYRRSIRSLDNYANYLQNLIDSSFNIGRNVGEYAKASIDDESVKGVVMVKVDPCPHIIYLDNKIFVRHSAKTEPLLRKDEIELFMADRKRLYDQLISASASQKAPQAPAPVSTIVAEQSKQTFAAVSTADDTVAPSPAPGYEATQATDSFTVATSKIRQNILHEYSDPDHFVTPKFYIRFVNDHDYIVTTDEWSIDTDTDRLALTVLADELDHYLLLVYSDNYAVKVKLREFIERKSGNVALPHYPDRKLVFVSPVAPTGGLYSLHGNAKNTLYERITPIDRIPQGSMSTSPERFVDIDALDNVMYDVVSPERLRELSPLLSTNMKRTQIGSLVKGVSSLKTSVDDAIRSAIDRLK